MATQLEAFTRNLLWALALAVTGCVSPGQHFDLGSHAVEPSRPADRPIDVIRITPATIREQTLRTKVVARTNPELRAAVNAFEYRVGPKDVLTFTVWDHPELTIPAGEFRAPEIQGHLVSADGEIFFPYIGTVAVAGQTLSQVRASVAQKLARFITDPQLDVRVAAFRSKRINVTGHVNNPGSFPLTDVALTLVEAINLAGGAAPEAALQNVTVIREDESLKVDLLSLLKSGDLRHNLLLQDGDIVYVPDNRFYHVHLLGSVREPGAIPMPAGELNLADVISAGGGFDNLAADASRVLIFRYRNEEPRVFWLDARKPDAMLLATQFSMRPQDVVFVDATGLARWNRIVSLILPSVQTLWQTQSFIDDLND